MIEKRSTYTLFETLSLIYCFNRVESHFPWISNHQIQTHKLQQVLMDQFRADQLKYLFAVPLSPLRGRAVMLFTSVCSVIRHGWFVPRRAFTSLGSFFRPLLICSYFFQNCTCVQKTQGAITFWDLGRKSNPLPVHSAIFRSIIKELRASFGVDSLLLTL